LSLVSTRLDLLSIGLANTIYSLSLHVLRKTPVHYRRHYLVTILLLALDPISFILGFVLGYLYYRWDIPLYIFDLIDARLYPIAVFFSIVPTYELIAQVYVYPLVGSGHSSEGGWWLLIRGVLGGAPSSEAALEGGKEASSGSIGSLGVSGDWG
jgi:hypothetical protein